MYAHKFGGYEEEKEVNLKMIDDDIGNQILNKLEELSKKIDQLNKAKILPNKNDENKLHRTNVRYQ